MSLTPIQRIQPLAPLEQLKPADATGEKSASGLPFVSFFTDAVENVKTTDAAKNQAIYDLAVGKTDNVHDVMIASNKATLAVNLLINLRNKALDAYKEITSMGV